MKYRVPANILSLSHSIPAVLAIISITGSQAYGSSATWATSSTDANWSTSANWGGTAPGNLSYGSTSTTDVATFNSAVSGGFGFAGTPIVIDSGRTIGGITFTGGAGNYVVGSTGLNTLYLSSAGTTQIDANLTSSNAVETINAPLSIGGSYTFQNNSANGTGAGAGTLLFGGAINSGSTGTLTLAGSNTNANTISGNIGNGSSAVAAVTKSGAGTWVLSGTNTYTGATTVNAGTLQFNGAQSMSSSSTLAIASGSTIALRSDTSATFTPSSFSLGASNTTLNFDVNQLSSGTNQTISFGDGMTFGANTTDVINVTGGNGYTLDLGNIYNNSGAGSGTSFTINATTAGASLTSLTTNSYGTDLILSGSNTITLGTIYENSNGNNAVTVNGGNVIWTGSTTAANSRSTGDFNVVLNGGTLNTTTTTNFANPSSSATTLLTMNGGTLNNASGSSMSLYTSNTLSSGGLGFSTSAGTTANNITFGNGVSDTAASSTITLNGSDVLSFSGGMTNTSGAGNILIVNNGSGTTSTTALNINGYNLSNSSSSFTDEIGGSGVVTFNGAIVNGGASTASGLLYSGTGTLNLSAYNTYGGGTVVSSGVVNLNVGGSSGAITGTLTINGGTVNATVTDALGYTAGYGISTLNVDGGTFNNSTSGNESYVTNFNLTGGTVSSTGGGYINFSSGYGINSLASSTTSTFSAPIYIRGGTLTINTAAGSTSSGVDLNFSGGIGSFQGGSGGNPLLKTGNGSLLMSGSSSAFYGGITVSAGTLMAGTSSSAFGTGGVTLGDANTATNGSSPSVLIDGAYSVSNSITVANEATSGTYTIGGANTTGTSTFSGGIKLNRAVTLVSAAGGATDFTGTISGVGGLVNNGSGTTILSGNNGYSGGTTVSSGTLELNNGNAGSATGSGALSVGAGAVLAGTGYSSGSSFSVTGNSSTAATVLVGHNSASDLNTTGVLSLTATGASSIGSAANLVFNLNAKTAGQGNQLSVGATNIAFNTLDSLNTTLTLNLQGADIIAPGTDYVLIAGTTASGGSGQLGSQYTGLDLAATSVSLGNGITETQILYSNYGGAGSVNLSFGSANSYYGANSFLFLYQDTNTGVDDIEVEIVPEPGTWATVLVGLSLLIFVQRLRRKST